MKRTSMSRAFMESRTRRSRRSYSARLKGNALAGIEEAFLTVGGNEAHCLNAYYTWVHADNVSENDVDGSRPDISTASVRRLDSDRALMLVSRRFQPQDPQTRGESAEMSGIAFTARSRLSSSDRR